MKKTKVEIRIIALRIANPYNILRQITNLPQQNEHPPQRDQYHRGNKKNIRLNRTTNEMVNNRRNGQQVKNTRRNGLSTYFSIR